MPLVCVHVGARLVRLTPSRRRSNPAPPNRLEWVHRHHRAATLKLQVPFIQLPLLFDAPVLAQEIEALGESVWKPHPQGFPGNSMLPLLAVDGDPDNEAFSGAMRPTPHLQRSATCSNCSPASAPPSAAPG